MTKNCLNCNTEISTNFCSNCGQKATVHHYSFQHFVQHDLIHGIWHVDSGILFTIKVLFTNPGHAIRAFIAGKRVKYFNYISLLIIIIGVTHFIGSFATVDMYDVMPTNDTNFMKEFEEFTKKYPKVNLLLTIPFYALGSFFWFKKAKLNLTEHFVLNSYKAAGEFIILLLFTIVTVFYSNIAGLQLILTVLTLLSWLYSFWFYRQYFSIYGYTKTGLIIRSVLSVLMYLLFSILIGLMVAIVKLIQDNVF